VSGFRFEDLSHAVMAQVLDHAVTGLDQVGDDAVREIRLIVPFDDGDLSDSITHAVTTTADGVALELSANTPYAEAQHENTSYQHAPGRTDHYISNVVEGREDAHAEFLAQTMRRLQP
jgi:hypothetical protein